MWDFAVHFLIFKKVALYFDIFQIWLPLNFTVCTWYGFELCS